MKGKDAAKLQSILRSLPKKEQLILLLHYADELTPVEVAHILHMPLTGVTESLARLRALFKAALEGSRMDVEAA